MNIIKNEIGIFMISETKIDNSFSISQFTMIGYSIPLRFDPTSHGGGILLFVREDIPSKIIKTDCNADFEGIFVEINLRKKNGYFAVLTIHIKVISQTIWKTFVKLWTNLTQLMTILFY